MNNTEDKAEKSRAEASNLPRTVAFQDEFTRGFMDSTKEVEDGYYLFKSKTDGYTMLFPENAKIATMGFEKSSNEFEALNFGEKRHAENISLYWEVMYENMARTRDIDVNLEVFSERMGYKGEYTKFNYNGNTYYYGKEVSKVENNEVFTYLFYIKSDSDDKAISYFMDKTCTDLNRECKTNEKVIEQEALKLVKSINFID